MNSRSNARPSRAETKERDIVVSARNSLYPLFVPEHLWEAHDDRCTVKVKKAGTEVIVRLEVRLRWLLMRYGIVHSSANMILKGENESEVGGQISEQTNASVPSLARGIEGVDESE